MVFYQLGVILIFKDNFQSSPSSESSPLPGEVGGDSGGSTTVGV